MLSAADRERIEEAVRRAEQGTAGEIVVVVARRAGSYKSEPFLYGLLAALAVPWPLILATNLSAPRIFTIQVTVAALVMALASFLGHRAAPLALRRLRARSAAAREFFGRGLADTRGRTGVLLYVALCEHYAEVLGDVAIGREVAEEEWKGVIETLIRGLGEGRHADALVAAVEEIGAILARHLPPEAEAKDELPNRVVVI